MGVGNTAARAGRAAVALACAVVFASGCRDRPPPDPLATGGSAGPAHLAAVADRSVAFQVLLVGSQQLSPHREVSGRCDVYHSHLVAGSDRLVHFAAYGLDCLAGHEPPGNGRHGVYRTVADIPPDLAAAGARVDTPLGPAVVFSQQYYECTNSCRHWTEPVAVITLDRPQDGRHPSLVVGSDRGELNAEQLTRFLRERLRR